LIKTSPTPLEPPSSFKLVAFQKALPPFGDLSRTHIAYLGITKTRLTQLRESGDGDDAGFFE
jgi:hypothetical protein